MSSTFEPNIDLFGDPIPANWGKPGRPEHVPSQQNRNKVSMLVALGWSNARIAGALFVTVPTLRKHYFSELHYRAVARDRLDASLAMTLWQEVQKGNVGAVREFNRFIERNDLMLFGQTGRSDRVKKLKVPKLGKKQEQRHRSACQNGRSGP